MNDGNFVNVTTDWGGIFDRDRLESIRLASKSRVLSRHGKEPVSEESLRISLKELSSDEIFERLVTSELANVNLEDENYALTEQMLELYGNLDALEDTVSKLKSEHSSEIDQLSTERDSVKALAEKRESEIIFLEDHARFSAEQTKLSISHWDLLLKNRDENIQLLTNRVTQLTNDSRLSGEGGITSDNYKCLLERFARLKVRFKAACKEQAGSEGDDESGSDPCPWRHQADVRVSQLERVTAQLNSTYDQLHAKSDELLLQNRELGSLRRKAFENEAKLRRYKTKIRSLKEKASVARSAEASSIHSSE
jgi:hypothetical protein